MSERSEHGPSDHPAAAKHSVDNVASLPSSADQSRPASPPRRVGNAGRTFELPPLPPASNITAGSFANPVTRVGGVSSILNPIQADEPHAGRRRKASHLESPASSTQSLPPLARQSQSPGTQHGDRPARRILTPRSPSLHRAASVGQLNPSVGTINAQTNPFPTSARGRNYTIEPGTSGAPPLPTPPAVVRPSYGFRAPTPPTEAGRRASAGHVAGPSASASPTTSYSSYSQGQTSPAAQYEPSMMTSAPAGSSSAPPGATPREHPRQLGIPVSSSGGQSVYQMMTLETTSGTVQVPVDVQAASRVADEKRRRNAGASARFRQRRKEKEKEAADCISRLEQQVKELAEDAFFYRSERDNLTSILYHMPGGDRHFPRPASPRHRRPSVLVHSDAEGMGYREAHDEMPRSPEHGRNVRRRTSTYSLPPVQQQQQQQQQPMPPPPSISAQPGYGPHHAPPPPNMQTTPGPLPSPHTRGPLPPPTGPSAGHAPPSSLSSSQGANGPPSVLQTLPQPGPYNPYAAPPLDRKSSGPSGPQREGQQ